MLKVDPVHRQGDELRLISVAKLFASAVVSPFAAAVATVAAVTANAAPAIYAYAVNVAVVANFLGVVA